MHHFRVVTPADCRDELIDQLLEETSVHNLMTFPGVARRPDGDLVQFDVAPEAANTIISLLRDLDLHRRGSIAMEHLDTALSDVAERAEVLTEGESSEAIIWEDVEARVREGSCLSPSYLAMMSIAVVIGAVGIFTDSPVLIVGAMVVGPDYGPIAGVTFNLHRHRIERATRAAKTLLLGYGAALVSALIISLFVRITKSVPDAYLQGLRPLTSFVSRPDGWSVVVAMLAGIAGVIALTQNRHGQIVGVLISVTTIPAVSNVAVALAMGRGSELFGALTQLVLNLIIMILVGVVAMRIGHWVSHQPVPKSRRQSPVIANEIRRSNDPTY